MAHELTIRRDGTVEMAYLIGTPVWHGLGNKFEASATLDEIREKAGMDWTCESKPLSYEFRGEQFTITDRVVQHRSDTGAPLGIVSSNFHTVQPGDAVEFFRESIETIGLQMTSLGTLFGGRKIWASAFVGEDSLIDARDKIRSYLLFSTALDGSMATTIRFTSVCAVCDNTLRQAHLGGAASVRTIHSAKFDPIEAKKTLGIAPKSFETFMKEMRALADKPVSEAGAMNLTNELLDTERGPVHDRIMTLFGGDGLLGADLEGRSGTAWGWLNAVTQFVGHDRGGKSDSHRLNSQLFGSGDRLSVRALELATAA